MVSAIARSRWLADSARVVRPAASAKVEVSRDGKDAPEADRDVEAEVQAQCGLRCKPHWMAINRSGAGRWESAPIRNLRLTPQPALRTNGQFRSSFQAPYCPGYVSA